MTMELPELEEGLLDEAALRTLCEEILAHTELDQVLAKGPSGGHTPNKGWDLGEALEALIGAQVRGIQLRYRYQGKAWFDTILRSPDGYRVVRMHQS